jgi:hypothetical protein
MTHGTESERDLGVSDYNRVGRGIVSGYRSV